MNTYHTTKEINYTTMTDKNGKEFTAITCEIHNKHCEVIAYAFGHTILQAKYNAYLIIQALNTIALI